MWFVNIRLFICLYVLFLKFLKVIYDCLNSVRILKVNDRVAKLLISEVTSEKILDGRPNSTENTMISAEKDAHVYFLLILKIITAYNKLM